MPYKNTAYRYYIQRLNQALTLDLYRYCRYLVHTIIVDSASLPLLTNIYTPDTFLL